MNCPARHPVTREQCTKELGHPPPCALPLKHRCHARDCVIPVKPEMLMCRRHWYIVPKALRDAVWDAYRPGQCDDKNPSSDWMLAADAAIEAVALKEGKL